LGVSIIEHLDAAPFGNVTRPEQAKIIV